MGKKRDRRWRKKQSWFRKTKKRYEKRERKNNRPGDYSYRAGWKDKHHIVNKCYGGQHNPENLLLMDRHRHNAWHLLFKNMSFLDVILLLIRVLKIKDHPDYPRAEYIYQEFTEELENGSIT